MLALVSTTGEGSNPRLYVAVTTNIRITTEVVTTNIRITTASRYYKRGRTTEVVTTNGEERLKSLLQTGKND
ncbi:MAG: hypothetical protein ACRC8Y_25440 [Chroococcales cyanobacterium]